MGHPKTHESWSQREQGSPNVQSFMVTEERRQPADFCVGTRELIKQGDIRGEVRVKLSRVPLQGEHDCSWTIGVSCCSRARWAVGGLELTHSFAGQNVLVTDLSRLISIPAGSSIRLPAADRQN